jgi:DNA-binding NarL/FixJ family response regulator
MDAIGNEPRSSPLRVSVCDRRRLIAEALAELINGMEGFTVVETVCDDRPLKAPVGEGPDLILLGVGSDSAYVGGVLRSQRMRAAGVGIVILADELDPDLVALVLDERLNGLLLTDSTPADLAGSMQQVAHGHAVMPAAWQQVIATDRDNPLESLSDRQLQVLKLLSEGLSYEEIGARLYITTNTVKFHVRSIFLRLGVRNRVSAARMFADRRGTGSPRARA